MKSYIDADACPVTRISGRVAKEYASEAGADMRSTSKFISLILRHRPEVIGITLDEHGWADVQALLDGINATGKHHLTPEVLEEIVRSDEKQRYAFYTKLGYTEVKRNHEFVYYSKAR